MAVEKRALSLGLKFLRNFYSKMRNDAIKKSKLHFYYSKADRKKASNLPIGTGGILRFSKEEVMPHGLVANIDELRNHISTIGEDPDFLIKKWRNEADEQVKYPDTLKNGADKSTLEQSMTNDDLPEFMKKRKIVSSTKVLDFD